MRKADRDDTESVSEKNRKATESATARVEVLEERETSRGWSYRVVVVCGAGAPSDHEVTLSWVDHNHWCGGTQAPSVTAERVLGALVAAMADGMESGAMRDVRHGRLPERFDLSLARRMVPSIDAILRKVG